ncbi:MAG: hypothetical protein ABSE07_03545 [Methanoregula sp.]|jgi:hypothetical protein
MDQSEFEYSPEVALSRMMEKLRMHNKELASQIQLIIDAGHDIIEKEISSDRKKTLRTYRKKVPYSAQDALIVVVNALEAYFVQQPAFIESLMKNISNSSMGLGSDEKREAVLKESDGKIKRVAIELQVETQIVKTGEEVIELKLDSHDLIEQQLDNIKRLRNLTTFKGGKNANLTRS